MFRFRWFNRIVRRNTTRIPEEKALLWKKRLNLLYIFFAWNAVGIALLKCINRDEVDDFSSAKAYAKVLNLENPKVIRISGFSVVDTYDMPRAASDMYIKEESEELFSNPDEVLKKLDSPASDVIYTKND